MKIKIFLLGRHSHRTPLSYPVYREIFSNYLTYVSDINEADLIILGFVIDIKDHYNEIRSSLARNPHQKIIVLSEEPLWDTVYSGDYTKKMNYYDVDGVKIPFIYLNHVTTQIYNFDKVPYFITTSNDYFIRYSFMFKRNSNLTSDELIEKWSKTIYKYVFYAEKRTGKWHFVQNKNLDVYGLCLLRTELTETINHPRTLKVGKGWENGTIRQELPDWHLDKIVNLDQKSFILSALENTHHPYYITEKIFDAFAVAGIPLYYASEKHAIYRLIKKNSFINIFNRELDVAKARIEHFNVSKEFIDSYLESQSTLKHLFSNSQALIRERMRIVMSVITELNNHYSSK